MNAKENTRSDDLPRHRPALRQEPALRRGRLDDRSFEERHPVFGEIAAEIAASAADMQNWLTQR